MLDLILIRNWNVDDPEKNWRWFLRRRIKKLKLCITDNRKYGLFDPLRLFFPFSTCFIKPESCSMVSEPHKKSSRELFSFDRSGMLGKFRRKLWNNETNNLLFAFLNFHFKMLHCIPTNSPDGRLDRPPTIHQENGKCAQQFRSPRCLWIFLCLIAETWLISSRNIISYKITFIQIVPSTSLRVR